MTVPQNSPAPERPADGIVLTQLDDACLVHFADGSVDTPQPRQLGEKLIEFIRRGGCRKLVISFDGLESLSSFLLDRPALSATGPVRAWRAASSAQDVATSDLWVG
jgi:hypothetical protein